MIIVLIYLSWLYLQFYSFHLLPLSILGFLSVSQIHQSLLCFRIICTSVFSAWSSLPLILQMLTFSCPSYLVNDVSSLPYLALLNIRTLLQYLFYFHPSTYFNLWLCNFDFMDWLGHFLGCKLQKTGNLSIPFSDRKSSTWHIIGIQQHLVERMKSMKISECNCRQVLIKECDWFNFICRALMKNLNRELLSFEN